jgi:hypothetical protein
MFKLYVAILMAEFFTIDGTPLIKCEFVVSLIPYYFELFSWGIKLVTVSVLPYSPIPSGL